MYHTSSLILFEGDRTTRLLSCQTQLSFSQTHLLNLNSLLEKHGTINEDRETCAAVRLCIIITLVTQAELHDDMRHNSFLSAPERVQHHSSCRQCLSQAVAVTVELSTDDYYYLDPYLGVGASVSHFIFGPIDLRVGDKVCWNRAIILLTEEQPNGLKPDLDPQMSLVPAMQRASLSGAETLDGQLSVLRLARRSVGMSVCQVPSGPKTLCDQLMEYRRANSLDSLGRFTEV